MTSNPIWLFLSSSLSVCVFPTLVRPVSLRPDPVFSKVVWSFPRLPTSLVLSQRRTWCNFLLISSSPPLRERALLPADGGREEGRMERRRQGEGQEAGLWLPPIRLPFSLWSLSPSLPSLVLLLIFLSFYLGPWTWKTFFLICDLKCRECASEIKWETEKGIDIKTIDENARKKEEWIYEKIKPHPIKLDVKTDSSVFFFLSLLGSAAPVGLMRRQWSGKDSGLTTSGRRGEGSGCDGHPLKSLAFP